MLECSVHRRLRDVGRETWNGLFAGSIEDYDYLAAVEDSALERFSWRYLVARDNGRPVAAMPAFLTDYALETTLTGAGRRMLAGLRERLPGALTFSLACLGSPCTETLPLGFDDRLDARQKLAAMQAMLGAFERHAAGEGARLLALKDTPEEDRIAWEPLLRPLGYRSIGGLPVAYLDMRWPSVEGYLESLGRGTRRDMRRKLRVADQLRIEITADIDAHLPRIMQLYRGTRARGEMQFEELTEAYFSGVLSHMPGRSFCVLYWSAGDLLGFNLLLQDGATLLDKFFCMDPHRGRELNLYFVSWFTNIRLCVERGLRQYKSGQAAYENKLRLGSQLSRTTMWFRHRNPLLQAMLRMAAPLLSADPMKVAA